MGQRFLATAFFGLVGFLAFSVFTGLAVLGA
jgi:hypothetical protein